MNKLLRKLDNDLDILDGVGVVLLIPAFAVFYIGSLAMAGALAGGAGVMGLLFILLEMWVIKKINDSLIQINVQVVK